MMSSIYQGSSEQSLSSCEKGKCFWRHNVLNRFTKTEQRKRKYQKEGKKKNNELN